MATTQQTRKRRRRIGPRHAGISMTPEEFDAIPPEGWDDRYNYELIRGVLIVSPIAGPGERDPNDYLGHLLYSHGESHPQGFILDLTLPEHTILTTNRRRCDRAIWCGLGWIPDLEKDLPTIVVEFVSGSKRDFLRDYEEKRDEYLAAGIREYWVVDRFRRTLTVFRPGPGGFQTQTIQEGESYQTDLLPGFSLPLARLLQRADRWTRPKGPRGPSSRPAE